MTDLGGTVIALEHRSQWPRDDACRHKRYANKTTVTCPLQTLSLEYGLWKNCDGDILSQKQRNEIK